jgi:hypothetical protein
LPGAIGVIGASASCAVPDPNEVDTPEPVGVATSAITVAEALDAGCSTSSVRGLSLQIIAQSNCIEPGAFSELPPQPNVTMSDTVFPFLEEPARDAFVAASASRPDLSITVNSMLRTVAQQYLLYTWYLQGRCGIGLAATPGSSNHETGLAFDTSQYSAWQSTLEQHGFAWYGSGDPVHFDYAGPGAVDYRGTDVLAFQMLWNDNHPEDPIDEDGIWGPETETRMQQAPADGFPRPVSCAPVAPGPDIWLAADTPAAFDRFADGASAGVLDAFEGDTIGWVVRVENRGGGRADGVTMAFDAGDAFEATALTVERSMVPQGPFAPMPEPPAPGAAAFTLGLGVMEAGEVRRITVSLRGTRYTVDGPDPAAVHAFAREVVGHYEQSAYGGDVTHDGTQSFGGGRLELATRLDVYSHVRWEFGSNRREGFTASEGAAVALAEGALRISGGAAQSAAVGPVTEVAGSTATRLGLRARREGGEGDAAVLIFADDDPEPARAARILVDLPADGAYHEVTLSAREVPALGGSIRRVAFVPFEGTPGTAGLDWLRIEGTDSGELPTDGADDGCDCATSTHPRSSASLAAALCAALAARARRRR